MHLYRIDTQQDLRILQGASCVFGVFDGVHLGHQQAIACACADAAQHGCPCVILTFDRDPDELFGGASFKKIMSNDARLRVLANQGAEAVAILPFTRDFANLSPQAFMDDVFGAFTPRSLHVGNDFRFGRAAQGTVRDLSVWGATHGMYVHALPLVMSQGSEITSTRIRRLLAQGDIARANELLGHRYCLTGTVVAGRKQGRNMGFRTANLEINRAEHMLADGVYAAYALVGNQRCKAAVSVGIAPTFAYEATAQIEAHLLDFDEDIYGQPLQLEFVAYLRPMRAFDSVDELIEVVMGDIAWVRENLENDEKAPV